MVSVRAVLQLFRIHTSNVTQVALLMGYLLAGMPLLSYHAIYWLLFGILFHLNGFLFNNICDYQYDLKDPAKRHFPLVSGEISIGGAMAVYYTTLVMMFIYGMLISNFNALSLVFLIVSIFAGIAYNLTSKSTMLSCIFIMLAFTSLPLFSYFSYANVPNIPIILLVFYCAMYTIIQNEIEGDIKDIGESCNNFVIKLGSTYDTDRHIMRTSTTVHIAAWLMNGFILYIIALYLSLYTYAYYALVLILALSILRIRFMHRILKSGAYDNRIKTQNCARAEICGFFLILLALSPIISESNTFILIIYSLLWYVVLNKVTWNTLLTPRV